MMAEIRRFEFPPKTQLQLKERVKAIAWATTKVGGWRGANVTASIQRYLQEAGYKTTQTLIKRGMDYLVEHDLAIAVVLGRRTVEFILAPDAEVAEPDFVKAQRVRATSHGPGDLAPGAPATNGRSTGTPTAPSRPAPPLPSSVRSRPPQLDVLTGALRAWYREDPEACDTWIAEVLRDLGVG